MTLFLKFHDGEGIPCQNNIMGSRGVGGGGGGQLPYETLQWDHRKKFIQNNLF